MVSPPLTFLMMEAGFGRADVHMSSTGRQSDFPAASHDCLLEKGELRGDSMKSVGKGEKDRPLWPHVPPIYLSVEGEAAA